MFKGTLPSIIGALTTAAALLLLNMTSFPVAAAETYTLDPNHTAVTFQYTHFGYSHPTGKFMDAVGAVILDETTPANSSVQVTFAISGLATGVAALDDDLKGPDFFDAAKYPTATFKSTRVDQTSPTTADVTGDLTIHGVTKPVTLKVTLNKDAVNPMMNKKGLGFTATVTLNRSDFGIGKFVPMVSDEINLSVEAEAYP